mmetsp:Transcript_16351/g.33683  ORF Transcript_16351/g.33683 Transcript_16351/m.33683 type:complete len:103 (-) Transcript_16351:23-331(-)
MFPRCYNCLFTSLLLQKSTKPKKQQTLCSDFKNWTLESKRNSKNTEKILVLFRYRHDWNELCCHNGNVKVSNRHEDRNSLPPSSTGHGPMHSDLIWLWQNNR